ncbi:hypothetical protein HYU22_01630 [Candidatus Woesearchaeota archaeon]|nr:hypothetical protein [Candidatus Woesearchaeota archaeon]
MIKEELVLIYLYINDATPPFHQGTAALYSTTIRKFIKEYKPFPASGPVV